MYNFLMLGRNDRLAIFIILIIAFLTTLEPYLFHGRPITYDGHIHITTIAQFTDALRDYEFPVRWARGFANYGLPLPIIAHQTPAYLGAIINLMVNNPVLAYNLTVTIAALLSAAIVFLFLRLHFKTTPATIGAIFYTLTSYKIINVYIRGALPELLAAAIIPLVLVMMHQTAKIRKAKWFVGMAVSIALLALTHPMMLVVGLPLFVVYTMFLIGKYKGDINLLANWATTSIIGMIISSYYLIPLLTELKYFYQGTNGSGFNFGSFLSFPQLMSPSWFYFYTHPGPRGHFIKFDLIESMLLMVGIVLGLYTLIKKRRIDLLAFVAFTGLLLLFLISPFSSWFYKKLFFLDMLQYAWRFLNALILLPPIVLSYLASKKKYFLLSVFILVLTFIIRVPQLYGKNYVWYPDSHYYFNTANLHSQNFQPIWAGRSDEYPIKDTKTEIIEGNGELLILEDRNSRRKLEVKAETDVRIADYTFYFPGWKVISGSEEIPIEFQDPDYRGVITYRLPAGQHKIEVVYKDTKARFLSKLITAGGLSSLLPFYYWLKRRYK